MTIIKKPKTGYQILKVFIVFIMSVIILSSNMMVYAADGFSLNKVIEEAQSFVEKGKEGDATAKEIGKEIQPIINTLYWIGVAVIIGISMYLGVQYFMSGGDAASRAEIRKKLVGFLISSAVLIAAFPIWKFVVSIVQSTSPIKM